MSPQFQLLSSSCHPAKPHPYLRSSTIVKNESIYQKSRLFLFSRTSLTCSDSEPFNSTETLEREMRNVPIRPCQRRTTMWSEAFLSTITAVSEWVENDIFASWCLASSHSAENSSKAPMCFVFRFWTWQSCAGAQIKHVLSLLSTVERESSKSRQQTVFSPHTKEEKCLIFFISLLYPICSHTIPW